MRKIFGWLGEQFDTFAEWSENRPNQGALALIVLAGSLGGIFAPDLYALVGRDALPSMHFGMRILFGIFAAGLGSILFTIANREDRLHFFFVALASAIIFPVVVGQLFPASDAEAIRSAGDATDVKQIGEVLANESADDLSDKGANAVQAEISKTLTKEIEGTVEIIPSDGTKISGNVEDKVEKSITELKEAGKSAGENGFSMTKAESVGGLEKIKDALSDGEQKLKAQVEKAISEVAVSSDEVKR